MLAGPWASQLLADYGADVIKIEEPAGGDDSRRWGPPWLHDASGAATGESAYYLSTNRGKRSVTLDLAHPEGARLARELALQSDVLLENFKVGGLARYGLGYPPLAALNPPLIYCSITGFGQDGPDAARPGYDAMIQAMGGLMSITGTPDGEPGAGPQKVGVAVSDLMAGMYAATAVLAALHERTRSGQGQHIDLALLDTQVSWLANQSMNYLLTGEAPRRLGSAHPSITPYQPFATADGFVMLAVGNDRQFASFCRAAGLRGARRRCALCHQRRPRGAPRRACRAADPGDADPHHRRVGAHARGGAGAVRADQRHRAGLRRAAGAPPRHAPGAAASAGRLGARGEEPGALLAQPRRSTRARRRCWASTPTRCCRSAWA